MPRFIHTNMFINQQFLISLAVGVFVGLASGYLGAIMILKRLALVGDALSHVALPGIGIALVYGINPFVGAFAALAIGILLIWGIEHRTSIPTEAVVGVIFAVSLAIGILVTPEPELLEALFGDISKVRLMDGILAAALSIFIFGVLYFIKNKTVLGLIAPDLAKSQGIRVGALELVFLLLVGVAVALGVKVVGTLLMGSLVVIPAAAAKNVSGNLRVYGLLAAIFGALSAVAGILTAQALGLPPGPIVVLSSAILFVVTILLKRE